MRFTLEILSQYRLSKPMTSGPTPMNEKQRVQQDREARLAKNLRDNLRRRKAATRKTVNPPKTSDDKPADSP